MDVGERIKVLREYLINGTKMATERTACLRKPVFCGAYQSTFSEGVEIYRQICTAVNGPPAGAHCLGPDMETACGCVHAEQRVILRLMRNVMQADAIVCTYEPCFGHCANLLLESRVLRPGGMIIFSRRTAYDEGRIAFSRLSSLFSIVEVKE